jgi:hypothetical protein
MPDDDGESPPTGTPPEQEDQEEFAPLPRKRFWRTRPEGEPAFEPWWKKTDPKKTDPKKTDSES